MVELVRAGRSPEDLAKEFEPTAQSTCNWVCQADFDEGRRHDGLITDQPEKLRRLHRENRQLQHYPFGYILYNSVRVGPGA
jgi:transposase